MNNYRPVSTLTDGQALKRLSTLTNNLRDAQCDLEDFLLELHDDEEKWDRLTYGVIGAAMGTTRQAAQQRVARLLDGARSRRRGLVDEDPNQLELGQ